ncbi:MAG: beta-galactosidase [Myxococcales bacterium]|nr:beta-galactosidase [Myxococcales bacterium]MBP6846443.1 beta-galactosidase [Kofleriaceae bacterium]
MEEHRRTHLDDRGLIVGDRALPWWSATFAYARTPRAAWPRALAALRGLGLTLVELPVTWGVHARRGGGFDGSGERDLGAAIDAAAAAGLAVCLELGPLAALEETFAGLPEPVVRDEAMWARAAHGGPAFAPLVPRAFPLPSLASTAFTDALAGFYRWVAAIALPRLAPDGPVVAIGLDAGRPYLARSGAYDLDYHPDAIAAWRAHRDVEPPRRFAADDAATCAAWVRWNGQAAARAAARWSAILDEAGLTGVARVGVAPPVAPRDDDDATPWPRQVDLASGTQPTTAIAARVQAARAPHLVRLPAGHSPLFAPTTDDDRAAIALAALAAGARGATWTAGLARDRWIGGLVDAAGAVTAEGRRVGALLAAIARHDLPGLRRVVDVALIAARADARVARASSLVAPVPPVALELLGLGPAGAAELCADADAPRARRWADAIADALALGQVAAAVVAEDADLAAIPARAFVAPTLRRIDRGLWRALHRLAADRRVVVFGPDAPTLDELDQPLGDDLAPPRRAGRMRPGSLDDLAGLAADLAALAPRDEWIATRPAGVTTASFAAHDGRVRALFVANRTARAARAIVAIPAGAALRDALTDAPVATVDGTLALDVPAHATRWLIVD